LDVWELQFKSKDEVNSTGSILKLELVSVIIKFEDVENFSVDIEVLVSITFFVHNIKSFSVSSTINVVLGEMAGSPFSEGCLDSLVLFLLGAFFSGESIWSIGGNTSWGEFFGRIKRP